MKSTSSRAGCSRLAWKRAIASASGRRIASEWLLTQFATARIGAVLVNINPAYRLAELEYALNKVGCKALIAAEQFKTSKYLEMLQTLAPELADAEPNALHAARLPELRTVIRMGDATTPGMLNFGDVMARGREQLDTAQARRARSHARRARSDQHPVHQRHDRQSEGRDAHAPQRREQRALYRDGDASHARTTRSAFRCRCITASAWCWRCSRACRRAATMVFPGEAFDPAATLAAVHEERCTALHGVPTMFIAELDHPDFAKYDFSRLRTGIMAGSPCPIETMKRVVSTMNLREITIAYGMTETSPVSFQSSTTDPLDKRTTTVGRIQPHLEVKIIDPLGNVVPVGETGELCTRGYSVMKGYWDDEAKTREAIVDGWMHTGDLATIDAEGYCNIVGRLKDMLIRGGENVYPREIEEFLFRHPKVQTVQVFGVPDQKYGEEVCAWIVLRPGEQATAEEIREFCQGQIAHYKIPRYIRFVDELPMTVTGKAQKFVMRARMIEELKVAEAKTA